MTFIDLKDAAAMAAKIKGPPLKTLIAGFKKAAIASIADALDQVVGKPTIMRSDMRPIIAGRIAGPARTALLRRSDWKESTADVAIKHSIQMIDNAKSGEVGVIAFEDGSPHVAALGGLMGLTAKERGMAGMIVDGGVRDVHELRRYKLPTWGRGVSPASAVGRYISVECDSTIHCAGVIVRPGDIVVAGEDGVVVVPIAQAEAVLKIALDIDAREARMLPFIRDKKSLSKAVEKFKRS